MAFKGTTKKELRGVLRRKLFAQPEESKKRKSLAIWRRLVRLAAFRQASVVCCYVSLPYEVQTWQMIERMLALGKRVVIPFMTRRDGHLEVSEIGDPHRDLAAARFGVWEPKLGNRKPFPLEKIDLVLVPGIAFDRQGYRLGHGHGYYDRFLSRMDDSVPSIGLCYDFQLVARLPRAAHDHPVHRVLAN